MRSSPLCAFLLVAAVLTAPARAFANDRVTTRLSAAKRVVTTDDGGGRREALLPFAKVLPGEEIVYFVEYRNSGDAPASDLAVTLPVPAEMTLVPDTAERAGVKVAYTVDGGHTFAELANLTVTNAAGFSRPARATDINAIRWTLNVDLAPGETGQVSYRAVLK